MIRTATRVLALAAALTASVATAQEVTDWSGVAAKAKHEGALMVYGTGPVLRGLVTQFEKATGIPTSMLDGRAGETRERVRTEQATGRVIADVFTSGAVTTTNMLNEGRFAPHGPLPNVGKLQPPFAADGTLVAYTANVLAVLANSRMVSVADQPKTWRDLTDPKWRDKIILDEPRTGGVGYVFFAVTYEKFGRGYQEAFAAQKPVIMPDPAIAERRLAAGEYPLYVGFAFHDYIGLKGLPVRVVIPDEGGMYSTLNAAMVKGAPHPNAARLFLNFILDDAAQASVSALGSRSTTGVVPANTPDDVRALLTAKLFGSSKPEEQAMMNKLASEIYK